MAVKSNHVAEMQGLYGPFTIAERVVQKIWLRGDFDQRRAVLTDGRKLEIRSPGEWNLLGGPDFRGAGLIIGDQALIGDVEVHFHAADWRAHGHADDPAYDKVALHVVLFPPGTGEPAAQRRDGREIPTLVLLPLLHRGLEEYASDDALEAITARDEWERFAELAAMPAAELAQLLQQHALDRWRQKVHFAKLRIAKLGWTAAHHTALEILGYRQNRAPMLTVAAKYPLSAWNNGIEAAKVFADCGVLWQTQGVRPANHPLARLQQYQRWVKTQPDWPAQLRRIGSTMPQGGAVTAPTKLARENHGLKKLQEVFAHEICGGAVSGTRLDNLVCDGFLPLMAAQTGQDLSAVWYHWFLGDTPAQLRTALTKLAVVDRGEQPLCHGVAQGLLGWILERETRASS